MNILDAVAISLPCQSCGGNYQVPLKDVLLSHRILHQGCPVSQETECPPVFQSRLFERVDVEELQRVWRQLENRARSNGGELVLLGVHDFGETQPAAPTQTGCETAQRRKASAPLTIMPDEHAGKRTGVSSKKREKRKNQERAHSKIVRSRNKKMT